MLPGLQYIYPNSHDQATEAHNQPGIMQGFLLIWRLNRQCWSVLRGSHHPLIKSPESVEHLAQGLARSRYVTKVSCYFCSYWVAELGLGPQAWLGLMVFLLYVSVPHPLILMFCSFFLSFFKKYFIHLLVWLCWVLVAGSSSLARDRNQGPCVGSLES